MADQAQTSIYAWGDEEIRSLFGPTNRTYEAASVRLLRLATNSFMDSLNLIVRTIHEFAPEERESKGEAVEATH